MNTRNNKSEKQKRNKGFPYKSRIPISVNERNSYALRSKATGNIINQITNSYATKTFLQGRSVRDNQYMKVPSFLQFFCCQMSNVG